LSRAPEHDPGVRRDDVHDHRRHREAIDSGPFPPDGPVTAVAVLAPDPVAVELRKTGVGDDGLPFPQLSEAAKATARSYWREEAKTLPRTTLPMPAVDLMTDGEVERIITDRCLRFTAKGEPIITGGKPYDRQARPPGREGGTRNETRNKDAD
jgi:hypothetical protein